MAATSAWYASGVPKESVGPADGQRTHICER